MRCITMGSLFDGIGGFPLAVIHNGVIPLWASEIEPFPIRVTPAAAGDPNGRICSLNLSGMLPLCFYSR